MGWGGPAGFLEIMLFVKSCYYRPQRSCGQGYVFTRVCDSAHGGGGVCLSACWNTESGPKLA